MANNMRPIYAGTHYRAYEHMGTLIVESTRKRGGVHITDGESAKAWIDFIENAVDKAEAHDLCRALMNNH